MALWLRWSAPNQPDVVPRLPEPCCRVAEAEELASSLTNRVSQTSVASTDFTCRPWDSRGVWGVARALAMGSAPPRACTLAMASSRSKRACSWEAATCVCFSSFSVRASVLGIHCADAAEDDFMMVSQPHGDPCMGT